MSINLKELEKRIEDNLIRVQVHPTLPLRIYNYTEKCQYERVWDEYTTMCRGLILDFEGDVVANPFPKFFNLSELEPLGIRLPNVPFSVYEKYDGSLGITFFFKGEWHMATRGSFTSDQALFGTKMLRDKLFMHKFPLYPEHTYLFEIIYPENRIVVDYGGMKDLVLLAVRNRDDGRELNPHGFSGWKVTPKYDVKNINKLKDYEEPNKEGFVIVYENGFRVKVKFDEYVRLHRIVTGINARRVWDAMRNGDSFDEFLTNVPEEFEKWIKQTRTEIQTNYDAIETRAKHALAEVQALGKDSSWERKQYAIWIMEHQKDISGIMFKMLDNNDYSELIWKMIKPEATDPYKVEI